MSVNPKKIAENIANDVASGVVKCIIESVCMAVPVVGPIVGAVASAGIDRVFENLRQDKPKEPYERIREICEQNLREEDQKHLTVISVITMQCVQSLDRFDYRDPEEIADELSDKFLSKKTEDFFDDAESRQLYERYLPEILRLVIIEIQNKNATDEKFRRQFDEFIVQYLKRHDEQLANHEARITTMEETIEDKKKDPNFGKLCYDRKDEYQEKWDESLFLDRNPEVPISKACRLTYYIDATKTEEKAEPETNLEEYMKQMLDDSNGSNTMLVVLGQPGIGKSTLVTWMLNCCNFKGRTIRVYRFTDFNDDIDWSSDPSKFHYILQDFLNLMGVDRKQELKHSVLILDGLDEINMGNNQIDFLNQLQEKWVRHIQDFSLIVTCRTNRIPYPRYLTANCIELCPFDSDQIDEFSRNYCQLAQKPYVPIPLKDSLEAILGIPIILYMVLALDIQVETASSRTDIYRKIFAPDEERRNTSIYYRPNYDTKHPVTGTKANEIHTFSKRIAVKMWESNPSEATIEKTDYQEIAKDILVPDQEGPLTEDQLGNLLIGQYFIEGQRGYELLFVHRSIYEYFVAVSIFDVVQEMVKPGKSPKDLYQQLEQSIQNGERCDLTPFATIMGLQRLPEYPEIQGYLLSLFDGKRAAEPEWWREFFDYFNEYGLSDAAVGRRKGGPVGMQEEVNRFYNLIWFVREQLRLAEGSVPFKIWSTEDTPMFFRVQDSKKKDLSDLDLNGIMLRSVFLRANHLEGVHLKNAHLEGAHLDGAYLKGAYLCGAQLRGAHLEGAILTDAHLDDARLYDAYLRGAHLGGAILTDAHLDGAYLRSAIFYGVDLTVLDLSHVDLFEADLRGAKLPKGYIIDRKTGHLLSRPSE